MAWCAEWHQLVRKGGAKAHPPEEFALFADWPLQWLVLCSIIWLGGQEDFPDWAVGAAYRYRFGNFPTM